MKNIQEMIDYSPGGILSKVIFTGEGNQVTLFSMAKGTDISEHTSTKEGYVYVIEGEGIFVLEGKEITMEHGAIIQIERNKKHSLSAKTDMSYLLFLSH